MEALTWSRGGCCSSSWMWFVDVLALNPASPPPICEPLTGVFITWYFRWPTWNQFSKHQMPQIKAWNSEDRDSGMDHLMRWPGMAGEQDIFSTDIWGPVCKFIGTRQREIKQGLNIFLKKAQGFIILIGQKVYCTEITTLTPSVQRLVLTAHRNKALWAMEKYRGQWPLKITSKEMNTKQNPNTETKIAKSAQIVHCSPIAQMFIRQGVRRSLQHMKRLWRDTT